MSYFTFKTYWDEVGPRVAVQLAVANGVTLAQAQLWVSKLNKGE